MGLQLIFELGLCSDYHVSAGHGLGALVDSALHRDADGLPVLRGTTLTGLLRDGVYQLLQLEPLRVHGHVCWASGLAHKDENPRFCGQHDPQQDDCPVCRIFGSPRTIKHWRVGSARPIDYPRPLNPKAGWSPGQEGTLIAPHVRVNPRTRRAEARKLFFREEGDGRLRFRFVAVCDGNDVETLEEAEWLVAAARFVRNLGASRRRGRGECFIHLVEASGDILPSPTKDQTYEEQLLALFKQHQLQGKKLDVVTVRSPDFAFSQRPDQEPVQLFLVARLDEPLIISEKAEAGNEFRTVDYVPGTALRGALAGRIAARYDLENQSSDVYEAFVHLFFRDGASFSPLYPAHRVHNSLYPTLPVPLDLLSCELYPGFAASETGEAHGAQGFALSTDPHPNCPQCFRDYAGQKVKMKPLDGFLSLRYQPDRVELDRTTEMHVHIDPITRRAASGDLFGFDTLAPGQYFLGQISCASVADWEDLCSLADLPLDGGFITLRLGKANRRGYGKVTLWLNPQQDGDPHPWRPLPLRQRVTDAQNSLVLTLLTDAIVPDGWGRFQTAFDNRWLSEVLGVQVKVRRSFCASQIVDGFNTHQGLSRWRDMALKAGSAVGLELVESLALDELHRRLLQVEEKGIGVRRNEGFGQIAFNHSFYDGCEQVQDATRLRLPRQMRLADSLPDQQLQAESSFRRNWDEYLLEYDWRPFRFPEFESVARLLRSGAPTSVEEVDALLTGLGRSTELLSEEWVAAQLQVREAEKRKLNFFAKEKGRAGLTALKELVRELAESTAEGGRRWRIGLEMVADRIAAEARSAEEGEQ